MKTTVHFLSYLAQFYLQREMFQKKIVEEIKTHILGSMTLFLVLALWDNVEKFCRAGQTTDDMAHVHCMPGN
jgi:hypothetical protein